MSGVAKPSPPATPRTPRPGPALSMGPATAWSLTDRLDLGCLPSAVPCARQFIPRPSWPNGVWVTSLTRPSW